jgi:hypothetical protein
MTEGGKERIREGRWVRRRGQGRVKDGQYITREGPGRKEPGRKEPGEPEGAQQLAREGLMLSREC